jgi:hypothetical protein
MPNTDDLDNGWDNLADEFGLEPDAKAKPAKQEKDTPAPPPRNIAEPLPEPEVPLVPTRVDDEPELHDGALFDPGPEQILEETDHVGVPTAEGEEEFDDTDSGELFDTDEATAGQEGQEEQEGQEGGKRKRKRRRRKKKRGEGEAVAGEAETNEAGDVTEETVPDDEDVSNGVEEGEAPEVLDEGDDEVPTSAVDEELEAVANQPKQEWNVMTWADLIGKLHRPG